MIPGFLEEMLKKQYGDLAESGRQLVHSFDVVSENGATRLTYKETREQMAKQQRIIAARKDNQGTIKDMPMADPDAEVASLSFTIPSWISSMTRIHNLGAVDRASVNAARRLQQQLLKLNETVEQMLAAIKEKA